MVAYFLGGTRKVRIGVVSLCFFLDKIVSVYCYTFVRNKQYGDGV